MSRFKENNLGEIVLEMEQDFISGEGTLTSKYVRTDLYEDINQIYAYVESTHISGEYDSMGREKPFFNICIAGRNVWYRATDIDRKHILAKATKQSDVVGAFLLTVHLQDWMRRERFGVFLNHWGMELATFKDAVVKFVEKDGRLVAKVVPWSRLIVDQVNFKDNIKIELLEFTEDQLYDQGYDKEAIEFMVDSSKSRELTSKEKKDNKSHYYKVYEVHGIMPRSFLTGDEEDEDDFVQQMHVLSFVSKSRGRGKTREKEKHTLFKGREEKDPYMLTSLMPATDGSITVDGAIKNLFNAQWMVNHTKKAIKDQLDLASKLLFQTSDGNFVGQNAMEAMMTGDILIHQLNQPLSRVPNDSHDITALQSFGAEWKQLSIEINGISEAMIGVAPKSGTAWRQVEALLEESHSLFEVMTENKALCIEDMCREFIFPYLKKKMDTSKEIAATLDAHGIQQIEKRFIKNKAIKNINKKITKDLLAGKDLPQVDLGSEMEAIRQSLSSSGASRFFKPTEVGDKTWKEEFEDLEWDVEVYITGETENVQEVLTTINTALQAVTNPNYANNPQAQLLVNKALTEFGKISPMELASIPKPQTPQPVTPPSGRVGAGELQVKNIENGE